MLTPKLAPLKVAWQVSPSTPYLRLVAVESAAQGETYVEFVAFYKCEQTAAASWSGSAVRVVGAPPDFQSGRDAATGPYRLVRLMFKLAIAARMCPAYADSQVIEESRYDWSDVSDDYDLGEQIGDYLARRNERWLGTGICPNPRAYEVETSPWIDELARPHRPTGWKHYMVLGHNSYVEVIAKGVVIEEGQVLSGW